MSLKRPKIISTRIVSSAPTIVRRGNKVYTRSSSSKLKKVKPRILSTGTYRTRT